MQHCVTASDNAEKLPTRPQAASQKGERKFGVSKHSVLAVDNYVSIERRASEAVGKVAGKSQQIAGRGR